MQAIRITIFNHLLAAIAEEMGAALMRAALSPNIKERRDFSCAVFDARGRMLAQAAHIPVHLGSQPLSVAAAIRDVPMQRGQSVILNDPYCGGTHLPDLTLVTPVFAPAVDAIWFYVANRAHHADVGGTTPGSLPVSTHIDEEGIRLQPTVFDDETMARILGAVRTPDERRGDLRAQQAANHLGAERLLALVDRFGIDTIRARGAELLDHSERVMRATIRAIPDGRYAFEDVLDDDGVGTESIPIRVAVTIADDTATVDFAGSSPQVAGPVNAVEAITLSACTYAFRCLAPSELPTNEGCTRPLRVVAPQGSVVNAQSPAPVAVGNVETSQRIVDVVLGALAQALPDQIPAASCCSMNNVAVGRPADAQGPAFAYYETIAGGAGAGPGWHGASAVHTHMTNTLNTPIEALEHAYPMRIVSYGLRRGSGGHGRFRGGDGVVRRYRFLAEATATVQTERRARGPWGLAEGDDGRPGRNTLTRDGVERVLASKCTVEVQPGDVLTIETPGGAGWGPEGSV